MHNLNINLCNLSEPLPTIASWRLFENTNFECVNRKIVTCSTLSVSKDTVSKFHHEKRVQSFWRESGLTVTRTVYKRNVYIEYERRIFRL